MNYYELLSIQFCALYYSILPYITLHLKNILHCTKMKATRLQKVHSMFSNQALSRFGRTVLRKGVKARLKKLLKCVFRDQTSFVNLALSFPAEC